MPCLHSLPPPTGPLRLALPSRLRAGCPSDTVCSYFPILHPRPAPLLFSAWGRGPGWVWSVLHLALVARLNSMADFRVGSPLCTARAASLLHAPHPGFLDSPPRLQRHRMRFGPRTRRRLRAALPVGRLSHQRHKEPVCAGPPPPPPPRSPATPTRVPGDRADRLGTGTDLSTTCALSSPGWAWGEAWTPRGS